MFDRTSPLHTTRLDTVDDDLESIQPVQQAALLRGSQLGTLRSHRRSMAATVRVLGTLLRQYRGRSLQDGNPPNECQYTLGYYRPGNCAPWIVPPVPISARGALTQGAVMTGAFWLIP